MTPAVSILVPIYKVSAYIERCAHSLFQQTFENIEYIFVNDCTPDDSIEKLQKIIEQYPNRKPFVKIIHHKKNRGLAETRNTALYNSTGKYIQHIDSDDYIELNMIEEMYKKAIEENADIVVCDYIIEKNNGIEYYQDFIPAKQEDYLFYLLAGKSNWTLWTKLVIRELYNPLDCKWIKGIDIIQDFHIISRLYYYAEKIVKLDKVFYHYNKNNDNALTIAKSEIDFQEIILFYKHLECFLKEKNVYEKYLLEIEWNKISLKIHLMLAVQSYKIRKKYAYLFRDFEMKYIYKLKFKSEKLILFFTHYKMYFCAHLVHLLLKLKIKLFPKKI